MFPIETIRDLQAAGMSYQEAVQAARSESDRRKEVASKPKEEKAKSPKASTVPPRWVK